jgi:uncharacterized membrane protein
MTAMEEPMLTATQHQRIDRYLAELAGALGELPETERADLVAGIREHIQAALADGPGVTDDAVDEVLRALGDPLTIAAEAIGDDGGSRGPAVSGSGADSAKVPLPQRDWVPAAVVALLGAAPLLLPIFISFGGIILLPFALVAGWVLLWSSPLWTAGEKILGTFVLPALGLVAFVFVFMVAGGSEVCSGSGDSEGDYTETCEPTSDALLSPVAAWIVLGVLVVGAIVTATVLLRNGRRRGAALAQSFSTGA